MNQDLQNKLDKVLAMYEPIAKGETDKFPPNHLHTITISLIATMRAVIEISKSMPNNNV